MTPAACAIGLGSNLGESEVILASALATLDRIAGIHVELRSQLYQTKPIGPPQPDYLNCCAILKTSHSPRQLLAQLLQTEAHFGRVRRERWGPRRLDIDILLFNDCIIDTTDLTVPHPHLHERAFVLIPLNEIAPTWIHPQLGKSIAELAQTIDSEGVVQLQT